MGHDNLENLKQRLRKFAGKRDWEQFHLTKTNDYLDNTAKQTKVKEYEQQIDEIVYKLYGLTEDEIAIVEGKK